RGAFLPGVRRPARSQPDDGRHVHLDVGFVRQHRDTCAPASLAAVLRYWGRPADHLAIAEAVCYHGTPPARERHWAEQQGWCVREFAVTWDSAVALLDRGVPFTLTFTEPTFGHMQAVIGYDSRRRTLLLREPSQRVFHEYPAE